MKQFSEDKYNLKSDLSSSDIIVKLKERTLLKNSLTMEYATDKDFIGRIQESTFSIFDSSFFPNGVACVLHGEVRPGSEIIITTTLHRAFRILFSIWLIAIMAVSIFLGLFENDGQEIVLVYILLILIVGFLFRLFLHGYYVIVRNRVIHKLKNVLRINNSMSFS